MKEPQPKPQLYPSPQTHPLPSSLILESMQVLLGAPTLPGPRYLAFRSWIFFLTLLLLLFSWLVPLVVLLSWDCYSSHVDMTFFFSYYYYYFSLRTWHVRSYVWAGSAIKNASQWSVIGRVGSVVENATRTPNHPPTHGLSEFIYKIFSQNRHDMDTSNHSIIYDMIKVLFYAFCKWLVHIDNNVTLTKGVFWLKFINKK